MSKEAQNTVRVSTFTGGLVGPSNAQLGPVADGVGKALARTEEALAAVRGIASKDAAMGYKLYTTLDELSEAARAIRVFAEYLERHPEALIRGKGEPQ